MIWLLLVAFLLVGCSGGGNDAPQAITDPPIDQPTIDQPPPPPPPTATLIYGTTFFMYNRPGPGELILSQTDGSGKVLLSNAPGLGEGAILRGTTVEYWIFNEIWHIQTDGSGAHRITAEEKFDTTPPVLPPFPPIVFGSDYIHEREHVGDRWIYERCPLLPDQMTAGQCDLYSVKHDGSDTVALGTTPQYEAFQGTVGGTLAIIRRVGETTDTLYSIPITGGGETFIRDLVFPMDWVERLVGDRIITGHFAEPDAGGGALRSIRPNGQNDVLLTNNAYLMEPITSTGSFVCYQGYGNAALESLWCVPADGSAAPTMVTDLGRFAAGLTP